MSILRKGCTKWTQNQCIEKKLDENYTRMLQAVLNKSWKKHPTKHQVYSNLPLTPKTIQDMQHTARESSDILLWTPTHRRASVGRPARTYLHQHCADTGCNAEVLPGVMDDSDVWWQTDIEIQVVNSTWWWWGGGRFTWFMSLFSSGTMSTIIKLSKTLYRLL